MSVNVPQTIWRDTSGLSEYGGSGQNFIVDPSGTFLVDPSGTFIVDTGVTSTLIPSTIWQEIDNV